MRINKIHLLYHLFSNFSSVHL